MQAGKVRRSICMVIQRRRSTPPTVFIVTGLYLFLFIEFNSGKIKIELDNTMRTVQPEQGRK